MEKYVSLDKRSKKAQREYHAKQRRTWGDVNPVTKSVPSGKAYNRKKEKQRTGREFSDGFGAGLVFLGMNLRILFLFCKNDLPILFLPLDECAEMQNNYVNVCGRIRPQIGR